MAKQRRGASRAKPAAEKPRFSGWLRRGVAVVMLLALIAAVFAGVAKLRDPRTLPLRTVKIEGELRHLDRGRLEAVATPVVSGGFFSVDLRAVERALIELPWVHRVSLRRRWPDTLIVGIREQRPVAQWRDEALVNPYGELFAPPPEEFPEGLPVLRGPDGRARELLQDFARFGERLGTLGLEVRALNEDGRRAVQLMLANGIRIDLGRDEREARLERFMAVYPRWLAQQSERVEAVDLRYTNGLAVGWRESAAAQTP